MKHIYETAKNVQSQAVQEFNNIRHELEKMHNAKIKVIKMFRILMDYKVLYELEENNNERY